MLKNIFILGLMLSAPAFAQEYGALIGVHQTDADTDTVGGSIDGSLNFKAGLAVSFELTNMGYFRTGVLYNQRHIEMDTALGQHEINFDYFDIPALFQYQVNEMFGLFGGLVVAVNVNDDIERPAGAAATDPDVDTLIPLLNLGVNLTFNDMVGFDFYYERGTGGFADDFENYNSFGANFLYWF